MGISGCVASVLQVPGFAITVVLTMRWDLGRIPRSSRLVHATLMNPCGGRSKTLVPGGGFWTIAASRASSMTMGFDLFSYELYKHFRDDAGFEQLALCSPG